MAWFLLFKASAAAATGISGAAPAQRDFVAGRSIPAGFTEIIERNLAPVIRGENPFFVERIWDKMYRQWRKPVAKGAVIQAIGAVDIAIWDIIGKALGKPAYQVLGGFTDRVRVYAAGGGCEFTRWGCRELLEARSAEILNGPRSRTV